MPAPGKFLTPPASSPSLWALRGQPFTKGAVTEFPPHFPARLALWSWELLALRQNHYYELRNTPISRNNLKGGGDSHMEGYSRGWRKVVTWDKRPSEGGVPGGMKRGKEERRERGRKEERGEMKESSGLGPWNMALSQGRRNKWKKSLIQTNTDRTWILLWIKPGSEGRLSNQGRTKYSWRLEFQASVPCSSSGFLVRRVTRAALGSPVLAVAAQEGKGHGWESLGYQFPVFPPTTWLLWSTSCHLFGSQCSHLRSEKLALHHL